MKPISILTLSFVLFFLSLVPCSLTAQDLRPAGTARGISGTTNASPASRARVLRDYGDLPLSFEANKGQTDGSVRFMSRGNGYTLFLKPTETVLALSRESGNPGTGKVAGETATVEMRLLGSDPGTDITGLGELRGKSNYFIGNDPTKWHTGIPTYGKVSYKNVYPGIDLVYYGNQRQLEYDFVVAPGANPNAIKLKIVGARKMRLEKNGDLLIRADGGDLHLSEPAVYQEESGERHTVAGRWLQLSGHELRFVLGNYDHSKPVIVDPTLVYSTYLGGLLTDAATAVAVDSSGNAYIAGHTATPSTDTPPFPTTPDAYQPTCNGCTGSGTNNAFVTELDPTGTTLIYSTYLGGNNGDSANGIAVDSSGDAYIVGTTFSGNAKPNDIPFPTTGSAFQTTCAGSCTDGDAFVAELNTTTGALVFSTFLGGSAAEEGLAIAVDSQGGVYVTGLTTSTDFPTQSPYQPNCSSSCSGGRTGDADVFVTKFSPGTTVPPGSTLAYSTYLGGTGNQNGNGIAVDSSGNAYVVGFTNASDFPPVSAYQSTCGGCADGFESAFVTKFDTSGAPDYSTFLSGTEYPTGAAGDNATSIAVDSTGAAYVAGSTTSTNFPTVSAFQAACANACSGGDAFVTKFNAAGSALTYSTYLGGSGADQANGIAVDAAGNAFVTGQTSSSTDFPTANPNYEYQTTCSGCASGGTDAFVSEFDATGNLLIFSTYLGGKTSQVGAGIAVVSAAAGLPQGAVIAGKTASTNFPTVAGSYQTTYGGGGDDAFVTAFPTAASCGVVTTSTGLTINSTLTCYGDFLAGDAGDNQFMGFIFAPGEQTGSGSGGGADCAVPPGTCSFSSSYTYPSAGTYPVSTTVNDATGAIIVTTGFTVSIPTLSITTQPASQTINSGQTATLSVVAAGAPTLAYQWYTGASGTTTNPITSATTSSYTTPALTTTTSYWVQVSNASGSVNSSTATVTVTPPAPVITTQPASQTISSGQTATMSVVATGTGLTYQWYQGASGTTTDRISGATSSSYTTLALSVTTSYWVQVSNAGGSADSNTATITVTPPAPVITTEPASQTINSGQTATLSVVASGTGLTYQWYQGASGTTTDKISGATSSSYTTLALSVTTSYWVQVSNAGGSTDSSTATITVTPPGPVITTQPVSQTINSGQTATLSVVASGTGLTYQWYQGTSGTTTNKISGATSSSSTTLALSVTTSYWVQVSNAGGSTSSNTATITLTQPLPVITTQPASLTIDSGQTAIFSVVATATGLTYQWYLGASGTTTSPIASAVTSSYTTPALSATASYWVQVTNTGGSVNSHTATITVEPPLVIDTTTLPGGTINTSYTRTTLQASGGIASSYSWSLASGSLAIPPGMNFSSAGVISGTPTAVGTFDFTVQLTDATGGAHVSASNPAKQRHESFGGDGVHQLH